MKAITVTVDTIIWFINIGVAWRYRILSTEPNDVGSFRGLRVISLTASANKTRKTLKKVKTNNNYFQIWDSAIAVTIYLSIRNSRWQRPPS